MKKVERVFGTMRGGGKKEEIVGEVEVGVDELERRARSKMFDRVVWVC